LTPSADVRWCQYQDCRSSGGEILCPIHD